MVYVTLITILILYLFHLVFYQLMFLLCKNATIKLCKNLSSNCKKFKKIDKGIFRFWTYFIGANKNLKKVNWKRYFHNSLQNFILNVKIVKAVQIIQSFRGQGSSSRHTQLSIYLPTINWWEAWMPFPFSSILPK